MAIESNTELSSVLRYKITEPCELALACAPLVDLLLHFGDEARLALAHAVDFRREQFEGSVLI